MTLAVYSHDIARHAIDIRYNFPNNPQVEALCSTSLGDIRVIHYLRTQRFDRRRIFATSDDFDHFLGLELQGSNLIFQQHVRHITGGHFPF